MPTAAVASRELVPVAEAASRLGVSPRTLRYYEELGLLSPARTSGGHRLYGRAEIEIVERIGRMQGLGLSLPTIRRVLRYRTYRDESGQPRLALADLERVVEEARTDVEAVHARIEGLRRDLDRALHEAAGLENDLAYLEQRLAERGATEGRRGRRR